MAVSGIDHSIKIFSPDTQLQYNARKGIDVRPADSNSFSSLNWSRSRRPQPPATRAEASDQEADSASDDEASLNGLSSRKRMHEAYQITSKNDMDRKGGRDDYFISQAVFAQLARHMAARQGGDGADGEGAEGEDGPIVISEDNCAVM